MAALEGPVIFSEGGALPPGTEIVDAYESALEELGGLEYPEHKGSPEQKVAVAAYVLEAQKSVSPVWVYYPWRRTAVKTVLEAAYFTLRTARNKLLMTEEEQTAYRELRVGVAGLSVGSAVVSALVMSGGPKQLKIADFDVLEITNLNRLRATLLDCGQLKTSIAARNVWELDPYADIELYAEGISKENLEAFLTAPKLDIFIDEMEALPLKILSRERARAARIPVLMATDNGDGILLDVERFDEEPERAILHGLVEEFSPDDMKDLTYRDWLRLATDIVGPEYLTPRMQDSILSIGKSIPSVPQLGTSARVAGAAMSFAVRAIANKHPLPSGRYVFSFEEVLTPGFNTPEAKAARGERADEVRRTLRA